MLLLLKWKVPLLPSYMPSWCILNSVWIYLYLMNHKLLCNKLLKPRSPVLIRTLFVSVMSSLSTQGACRVEHERLGVILPDPQWLTQRHPCSQTPTVSSCVLGPFFPVNPPIHVRYAAKDEHALSSGTPPDPSGCSFSVHIPSIKPLVLVKSHHPTPWV